MSWIREAVSNGNPKEQAAIRRWWKKEKAGRGHLQWEFTLAGNWSADALWFPESGQNGEELKGLGSSSLDLRGCPVSLLEAKRCFTPELLGQAVCYREFLIDTGAVIRGTWIFTEEEVFPLRRVAERHGIDVVVCPLEHLQRSDG